jgi:hypothetical protein
MPTLRAAQTSLQNGLPGVIAAYNAEAANLFPLDVPANARYFIPAEDPLGGAGGFPVVELYINHGSLGPFSVHRDKADVDDRATVCVWHERDRGELVELYEMIAGYGRCVVEVLCQDSAFGADVEIADGPGAVTYDYSIVPDNPEVRDFQKWRTCVVVMVKLEDVTDVP